MQVDTEIMSADDDTSIKTLRFKFSENVINELHYFGKLHQYDTREQYNDAWSVWLEEKNDIIREETRRLEETGYEGNIADKLYKSARYYYRKKSSEKIEPKSRRKYVTLDKSILQSMDNHIQNNSKKADYTPKLYYEEYCREHKEVLASEIERILNNDELSEAVIQDKFKKTYKNRYYLFQKA